MTNLNREAIRIISNQDIDFAADGIDINKDKPKKLYGSTIDLHIEWNAEKITKITDDDGTVLFADLTAMMGGK